MTQREQPQPLAWHKPGVELVVPGVYRIPLPMPHDKLKAINVYALLDGDGITLIDGGWDTAESLTALRHGLAQIDFTIDDVTRILVTHMHFDHYSMAVTLRRLVGMPVHLGRAEHAGVIDMVTNPLPMPTRLAERLVTAGGSAYSAENRAFSTADDAAWEYPDSWLAHGDEILLDGRRLVVLETPGHTHGHVVFHEPDAGLLFSGDHVLPGITPSVGFEPVPVPNPLRNFLSSLGMIADLEDTMLLPSHGPVTASTYARVTQLIAHHERRLVETLAAVESGASSARECAEVLTWTRHLRSLSELDTFDQMLAINETLAHLDVLVDRGHATADRESAVWRYSPAARDVQPHNDGARE